MKKIILLIFLFLGAKNFAQTNGITYQAVILKPSGEQLPGVNNSNAFLVSKDICMVFKFIDEYLNVEYQEVIQTKTDEYGMVNLVIGTGSQTAGYADSFKSIVWNSLNKNLVVGINTDGNCSNYTEISNQPFSYVPLAFSALTAENVTGVVAIENGGTNAVTVLGAKTNLGLDNVNNTSDVNKPVSIDTQAELNLKENLSNKSLNITADESSDTKYPSVKAVKAYVDAQQNSDALTTEINNRIAADLTKANIASPTFTGTVSGITATMVGLSNVDNTSDVNKPVSTATQTAIDLKVDKVTGKGLSTEDYSTVDKIKLAAITGTNTGDQDLSSFATNNNLDLKANIASPTFTGTVSGITATMVGLSNVDNTSDVNKPVSTAAQSALDLKANLASPTFTGTVSGITKTMVGLSNVDNTSDYNKPVSNATQIALNLKANLASPILTGTPSLPTGTIGVTQEAGDDTTALATTAFVSDAITTVGSKFVNLTTDQSIGGTKTFSSEILVNKINIAQGGGKIGIGTTSPDQESSIEIATALPIIFPSMSQVQVDALVTPKIGMVQFNTTEKKLQVYSANTTVNSTVFGNNTLSNGATCLKSGPLWFTPTVTGTITKIELNAFGAGETASIVVKSDSSCGTPSVLGTSNSITCTDGWNTWVFSNPVSVIAGTTYYITSDDASSCLGVRWSNSGDDATTGYVDSMMGMPGMSGCTLSSNDPASRITVVLPSSNGNEWLSLFNGGSSSGLVEIANGGTGSSTKNFVDLTTDQSIDGAKTFNSDLKVNGLTIGKGNGQVPDQNITLGEYTLVNNTNGQILIAIGKDALYSNTTANYNIGIGVSALSSNQTGENNTAIGATALVSNKGSNNTAIGRDALFKGNLISEVTGIGYKAGYNNTGSSNTFLGSSTDQSSASTSITNSTAIGYGAKINAANQVQLGNTSVTDVKTAGTLTAGSVTYPNAHNSTSGQVLTMSVSGLASWENNIQYKQVILSNNINDQTPVTVGGLSIRVNNKILEISRVTNSDPSTVGVYATVYNGNSGAFNANLDGSGGPVTPKFGTTIASAHVGTWSSLLDDANGVKQEIGTYYFKLEADLSVYNSSKTYKLTVLTDGWGKVIMRLIYYPE